MTRSAKILALQEVFPIYLSYLCNLFNLNKKKAFFFSFNFCILTFRIKIIFSFSSAETWKSLFMKDFSNDRRFPDSADGNGFWISIIEVKKTKHLSNPVNSL